MHYRVYWLDMDNHIRGAANIDCSSDEQARRLAAVWLEAWPSVEVWCGRSRIARLEADRFRSATPSAIAPAFIDYMPEHWRERAEEARVIADTMYDPDAKRAMERAAESAERIAQLLDQRQRASLSA